MNQVFSAERYIGHHRSGWIAGRVTSEVLRVGDVLSDEEVNQSEGYQIEKIEAYDKSLELLPHGMTGALKLKGLPEGGLNLPCLLYRKGL